MTESFSHIATDIESEFHKPYREVVEEVWWFYYDEILEVLPYIGRDGVSGTFNLTGATLQIALAEVGKKYGMSTETWGKLMVKSTEMYFKSHFFKLMSMKLVLKYPKLANMAMKKSAEKNRKNALQNPGSFETEVVEPTEEYPVIMHNTVCPIYNFAKAHGYMAYMPYESVDKVDNLQTVENVLVRGASKMAGRSV